MPPPRNRRSSLAIRRLSPLLLPAAVLMALALLLAPGAQPAKAQTTVWSATLTVRDLGGARYGCDNSRSGDECSSALTDDGFTYDGVDYEVTAVNLRRGTLIITLDTDIPAEMNVLTLLAGGASLNLADNTSATYNSAAWNRTGLDWSEGDTVSLSLKEPPPRSSQTWIASPSIPPSNAPPIKGAPTATSGKATLKRNTFATRMAASRR